MKIKLHELSKPLELSLTLRDGWLRAVFTQLKTEIKGPFSLFLKIEKDKDVIFMEGHLKTTFVLTCSRCTNDMDYPVDEFFKPMFIRGREPRDLQISDLSSDATYFQSDELDMSEILHEQIVLAAPYQPVCSLQCKGICPQCGQDLNVGSCQCKKEETQSHFLKLKTLRVEKKRRR
ncbi:MAG: DUF177 domain-containing protein [Deltaproteobacteria bacterium]